MKDLLDYIDSLKNYEKSGVPTGAGTDSHDGFDLGRMRRLMDRFGNPHSKFKVQSLTFSIQEIILENQNFDVKYFDFCL
jgi:hypothetical protein